jgi:glutamyl/glutaminyl-tRNA synthetase
MKVRACRAIRRMKLETTAPIASLNASDLYAEHTERLLRDGKAYPCFCTAEELEAERKLAIAEHGPQVYSGRCRALSSEEVNQNIAAGKPFAVRLKIEDHPLRHDRCGARWSLPRKQSATPSLSVRLRSGGGESEGILYNYVVTIDDAHGAYPRDPRDTTSPTP